MSIKASLKIQLFANDVLVAESGNAELWQNILSAVQGGEKTSINNGLKEGQPEITTGDLEEDPIQILSEKAGVTRKQLIGSCDPHDKAPFIHLDPKYWEEFKKNTPKRGTKAVSKIQLSGTLLCLWYEILGKKERPKQVEAQAVLETIGLRDRNATRSIKNCEWLQNRNGAIQINPAEYSKAIEVVQAYITQSAIKYN